MVFPAVVPNALFEDTAKDPALTVIFPVKLFDDDKVKVPVPTLVKAPLPDIVPEKFVLVVSPAVKVCELAISIVPAPAIDPIVSEASTSYVAPDATETLVELFKVPVTRKVPAEIVVSPL